MRRCSGVVRLGRRSAGCSVSKRSFHASSSLYTTEESWKKEFEEFDMSQKQPFKGKDIISAKQFNRDALKFVIDIGDRITKEINKNNTLDICRGRLLGNVILEPSTRTASSFHSGMVRLGGTVIPINAATSSALKGETFSDTVRVVQNYVDVIVLRHSEVGAALHAAEVAHVPVINAGDGKGEHPTQALLDVYTVYCERGQKWSNLEGLTWTLVGDLKYGRTTHSLSRILTLIPGTKINYVSTDNLKIPDYIKADTEARGVKVRELNNLEEVIGSTDVIYQTRIQKERFTDLKEYEAQKGKFIINPSVMSRGKSDMMLLHPLPRVDEITDDVDQDSRAKYFIQPRYGMITRMALLSSVIGRESELR
eukprot:TRINITY_DN26811_c0_g1_i1.p1 TRINITY_DN26811_c0_g1~~TRINITY_DN26811_c0_g1_i1.p1  ORF type:complete len:366 (-),score=86.65 TRINITY_DN26811_c0_g1_i1:60-1157(-)